MNSNSPDNQNNSSLAGAPVIDQIEILAMLGTGAMSRVFKARQIILDRVIAVKVLNSSNFGNESAILRFQQEAKLSASLDHPNIAKTLGSGTSLGNQPYLLVEYIEGHSLEEELKRSAPIKFRRFQEIFIPLLSALDHAHKAGFVHRDIKPGNIMICKSADDAESDTVKLVDFGVATIFDTDTEYQAMQLTRTGAIVGSPAYMSPEQCTGVDRVDGRADLYSLSCVMYQSLCGELPFSGNSALEVMHQHATMPLPSTRELSRKMQLPPQVTKLIMAGLAKSPGNRPATASEFAQKLNKVLAEITLDRAPMQAESRTKKNILGMALIFILGCAALLCAVLPNLHKSTESSRDIWNQAGLTGLSESQLSTRAQHLDAEKKYGDEFACWEEIIAKHQRNRHGKLPSYLIIPAASSAYSAARAEPDKNKARTLALKSYAIVDKALEFSSALQDQQSFLEQAVLKTRCLTFLQRNDDLINFIHSIIKSANSPSFDLAPRLRLELGILSAEFEKLRPLEYESLLRDMITEAKASQAGGDTTASRLTAQLYLARLLRSKGKIKEALSLCKSTGKELIEQRDIKPSSRCEVLQTLDLLDPESFKKACSEDIQENAQIYASDLDSLCRVEQNLGTSYLRSGQVDMALARLTSALAHSKAGGTSRKEGIIQDLIKAYTMKNDSAKLEMYKHELENLHADGSIDKHQGEKSSNFAI